MALRKSKELVIDPGIELKPEVRRSLVASAVQVNYKDLSYNLSQFPYNGRDIAWQRELWRLYNVVPEFHYAANWVGNCCSQVRIFVAEVDKMGRVQAEVAGEGNSKKARISALSDKMFGGPAGKREALRYCGINATVVGEFYILGKSQDDGDKWYIVSPTQIRQLKGELYWGDKWTRQLIDLSKEMLTRVWTPNPEWVQYADSPARACQPVLRELEQLTKYVFSQIDSRLVGAGLLIMPSGLDFPKRDGEPENAADSLMMQLATAGASALKGEGTAAAVLPHMVESPADMIEGWKLLEFSSELSKQALELRAEAIRRLGLGLDMPPEALSGMGEANHWAGWFIDGYGIKVHIEPLMNRICDALTSAYLRPALKLLGEDPDRYVFSYDTAALQVRPQRLQDALNLYEKKIVGAEAVRTAGFFKESEAMDDEELSRNEMFEIVLRDPSLIQKQSVREMLGIDIPQEEFMLSAPGQPGSIGGPAGAGPPPPPPPPTGIQSELPGPMPDTLGESPGGAPGPAGGAPSSPGPSLTASATREHVRRDLVLTVMSELVVRRAMEVAGKRLLDRHNRDRWPDVPHFDLHTRIRVTDGAHARRLLQGAWKQLPFAVEMLDFPVDIDRLETVLTDYCATLLVHSAPHESENLYTTLTSQGFTHGR